MNTNIKTSKHKHKHKNKTNKRKPKTNKRKLKIGGFGFFGNNISVNNSSCVSSNVPTAAKAAEAANKAAEETKKAKEAAQATNKAAANKAASNAKAAANSADQIKVISYNISWGSMSGNTNDITARKLAKICKDNTIHHKTPDPTMCLINVREFLDTEYTKGSLDFIALQEALNWKVIINESNNLKQMGYVHHKLIIKTNNIDLCTLYNSDKFKLLGVSCGNIATPTENDGRPYHMLFLKKISNEKKYIFINFHNRHNITKDELQTRLVSNNIVNVSNNTKNKFEDIDTDQSENLSNFINTNQFNNDTHIIMAGDTNDHSVSKLWTGIKPFEKFNIPNLKNIVVDTKPNDTTKPTNLPPKTCCIDGIRTKNDKGPFYGDYIMISDELEYIKPNYVPEDDDFYDNKPASDHLPVMATIKEKK
jgi:hypothetical protein